MAEMRRLIVELRKKMLDEAGSGASAGNFKSMYEKLLTPRDRNKGGITLLSLTPYIQRVLNLQLTPGEFTEIFRQIDTDGNGFISHLNLSTFLSKSSHDLLAGGSFDDSYCVVDVAVSKTKNDEQHLRHLNYHKINEDLNRGAPLRPTVYLWWRSACLDDYENERAFLKDRVTDLIVSPKHRDSMLTAEGFTCIDKSVSSGKLMPGGHAYIWIRKDAKDPQPVLNIAVTTGKAKRPRDKIHFPPFYGFKLTEPEYNLNKTSMFGSDVFLWYRKKHFETEKARGKAGKVFQKGSGTALAAIAAQVKKVIRESYVDRDGQVDLEKAFSDFDRNRNGYISYRQFRTQVRRFQF
jgi:Ca2+-binding EF-hand superfamily protein